MIPRRLTGDDGNEIAKAVLIAGLSALVTEIVQWGVEELREAIKPKPRAEETKS